MPDRSRRRVLKTLGAGLTGLAVIGNAQAAEDQSLDKTDFDPSDRQEVLDFIAQTFEDGASKSDEEVRSLRSTLRSRLSEDQKKSIGKAWEEDIEITAEKRVDKDPLAKPDDVKAQEWEDYSYTIAAHITVPLCPTVPPGCYEEEFHAYDFTHELEWFYSDGEVTSGTASTNGNGNTYPLVYWRYEGVEGSSKEFHPDGHYVKTWRQGKVVQHLGADFGPSENQYPECWLQGDNNGFGSAYGIETK